ncbi:MAG TPA: winged helix DNA-binding domain-containing protein [Polyangia bacterium]|nr:winged helix DNA-binding domain-containing protein [Polyangia bacterium]
MPRRAPDASLSDVARVAARRLAAQAIARHPHAAPAALVAWMGAIQAQDPAGARWAVALRLGGRGVTEAAILRALETGAVIRTHAMRWTWQLVAASDLHWLLPVVAPVMIRRAARRFRELDLDEATFRRSRAALERALAGGAHLTRDELGAALQAAGVSTADGRRLSHLLGRAELDGVICSGAPRGKTATFALLEGRVPRPRTPWPRERALAELARRYFRSRGPATLADFVWWAGIPPAEARAAIQQVEPELARETLGGQPAWRDPAVTPAARAALADAHLVPPFDEILVAYKDRAALLDPAHARRLNAGGGMLAPCVLPGGRVAGTWRRALGRDDVAIRVHPFDRLTAEQRAAIAAAAQRYAAFLQLKAAVEFA